MPWRVRQDGRSWDIRSLGCRRETGRALACLVYIASSAENGRGSVTVKSWEIGRARFPDGVWGLRWLTSRESSAAVESLEWWANVQRQDWPSEEDSSP